MLVNHLGGWSKTSLVTLGDFCGASTPTMADFKLLIGMWSWDKVDKISSGKSGEGQLQDPISSGSMK